MVFSILNHSMYETGKLVRKHLTVLQTNGVLFLSYFFWLYIVFAVDCRGNTVYWKTPNLLCSRLLLLHLMELGGPYHFGVTMNPPIFNTFLFNAWNHKTRPSFELFMEQLPRHCSILRMVHGTINLSLFYPKVHGTNPTHIQYLPPCAWNQMVHPCSILWFAYGTNIP